MRRLVRLPLSPAALHFLKAKRTNRVAKKRTQGARVAKVRELWPLQRNKAFVEIRRVLREMCSGVERCMYCEDSRGVAIDHFWPLSLYPLKAFEWSNYLYVCTPCNAAKGDTFPCSAQGDPVLLDPTSDDPAGHLLLAPRTGKLQPLTPRGATSRSVYDLDRDDLAEGRRNAWIVFKNLIVQYARLRAAGRDAQARLLAAAIQKERLGSVFAHLLSVAQGPSAARLDPDCVAAISAYPEIKTWA